MGYQNNGTDHGVPEQWGRPWGTRTMGADHGVPEQWGQTMGYQNNGGRPWGTRAMGQTMGYQNNGADNGLFEGSIMFCSNKLLISSLKTSCAV